MFLIAKINKKITFSPESSKKRCIQYIYKIISSKIFSSSDKQGVFDYNIHNIFKHRYFPKNITNYLTKKLFLTRSCESPQSSYSCP